ncbi:SDR family oxidoreductase [Spongiactinospora sp. TRM90649]|uniref:SDR family NAD(P)-dependent oxidoreductase n=1 Tax=Spongiactinospora sp. TRM90649 TaxID=3031114 RepID=UPI0023F93E29|nr:SDR family oxidoreductase [Spongiactinospora sp. TRM90649]MDF5752362.1 SDR family oxidoreductase [Spongiactinospora sp. TRM90649]
MPTALITGATSGIGAAFARRLAGDGFSLVLVARDAARLEETAAELTLRYGVPARALPADLSDEKDLARVEQRVHEGIDLLVNNAGFAHRESFLQVTAEDEVRMLRLHCEAVLRLTLAALPWMRSRGRGGVINVSSVVAFFAHGSYSASKAWVVRFSESAGARLAGTGVRVMALCPGYVRSEFHQRAGMDVSGIPGPMWLEADQVVGAAMRDLATGRLVSVPSLRYKAIVAAGRLIPLGLGARLAAQVGD